VVDLPTATEPAMPITNGTLAGSLPRNVSDARYSSCAAPTYRLSNRDSGRKISATSSRLSWTLMPRSRCRSSSSRLSGVAARSRPHWEAVKRR
jgi:hypothetical protein